jgi:photosystem II stability/assembly factor-like uncharacterized protein
MRPRPLLACVLFAACAASPTAAPFVGSEWRVQQIAGKPSLRSICAVGETVLWASGTGTVLRTTDGGVTWINVGPADGRDRDFRAVAAFDRDTAVIAAVGAPARLLRTTDGGATWRCVYEDQDPKAFLDGLAFWDRQHGLCFGDPRQGRFDLLRTDDGGVSWSRVDALPPAVEGEGGFAASNGLLHVHGERQAFIVTGGPVSRCLRSDDQGRSWSAAPLPLRQGPASAGAFAVAFADDQRGVAVGGDYEKARANDGTAAFTRDGGRSWQLAPTGATQFASAVAFVPGYPHVAIAVGEAGTAISRDDGASWQALSPIGFHALAVTPRGQVFAAGGGGRIGRLPSTGR